MKLSEFKLNVPKNAVAKYPADPRDSSNLMVIDRKTGKVEDKQFKNILSYML